MLNPEYETGELVHPTHRQALFEDVFSQLHRLHMHWWMYVTFFGDRQAVETVRRAASRTFAEINELLLEAIVLDLSRLLAQTRGKRGERNACVQALLGLGSVEDKKSMSPLYKDLERVKSRCATVFDWRKRVVAHRSQDTALKGPPPKIYIRTVRQALVDLSSLLQSVSDVYGMNMRCDFGPDTEPDQFDADVLLARVATLPTE
jgi:hypothetical protein